MPLVARFVDDLRAAFGADLIDAQIKRGMRGEPVFWASEGEAVLGTRCAARGTAITVHPVTGIAVAKELDT